jgi:membrane-associated protease RseP (regulator of RpoE activity)
MSDEVNNVPEKVTAVSLLIFSGLLLITLITTTFAGIQWISGQPGPYELDQLLMGLPYSLSILFILSAHEFGHYFATRIHKVKATLPFFIPFPPIMGFFNFGTMGALIKTKTQIPNNKVMFDIGVWGPISGFIACLIVLIYGFTHLPPVDYLLTIHPDYFSADYGKNAIHLEFGNSLLLYTLKNIFTTPGQFIPPMSEIYHYPYICAGWLGLFVTAMNMIPVGQLDGGHIIYSMFGSKKHEVIASISLIGLIVLGISGTINALFTVGFTFGWTGWLLWALILYFFIKIKHPPVTEFIPLDTKRKILGWIAIGILVLSFMPTPFIM